MLFNHVPKKKKITKQLYEKNESKRIELNTQFMLAYFFVVCCSMLLSMCRV